MVLRGADGIKTRMVCGYNPCYSVKKVIRSIYQQQMRYFITTEKDRTCPRTRFKNNLLDLLRTWRDQGNRIIVCMDVNEDIYRKSIGRALTELDDLQMIEDRGRWKLYREENWCNIL